MKVLEIQTPNKPNQKMTIFSTQRIFPKPFLNDLIFESYLKEKHIKINQKQVQQDFKGKQIWIRIN